MALRYLKFIKILALILLFWSVSGVRANVQVMETDISPGAWSFNELNPDRFNYFSEFVGPSIGNSDPINEFGGIEEGGVSTWTQISLGWELNRKIRFVANPRFVINHNNDDPTTEDTAWDDPVFGIAGEWFSEGNLSFGGGINTIVPVFRTKGTIKDGVVFNPGGFNSINYVVNSKVSVGSWMFARVFIYDHPVEVEDEEERVSFFVAPTFTYTYSDNFKSILFYQYNGKGYDDTDVSIARDDTLSLLLSYTFSQEFVLEPIFSVFRANDYDFSEANLTVWLSGRLF